MIMQDTYWIYIIPSDPGRQTEVSRAAKGKWLCFGPTPELHLYLRLMDQLVEDGTFLEVKIALKNPQSDPFPHKECVMCVFTASDEQEKTHAARKLKEIGLSPVAWKSDEKTVADWLPGGRLALEAKVVRETNGLRAAKRPHTTGDG